MLRHRAQVALHQAAGGFLRIARALPRPRRGRRAPSAGAPPAGRPRRDPRSARPRRRSRAARRCPRPAAAPSRRAGLRGHNRSFPRARRGSTIPASALTRPSRSSRAGKLDQVGDVGRVERLDQPARGFVVAGLDRVEDLVDELRAAAGLPRRSPNWRGPIRRGRGGDVLALAHSRSPRCTRARPPMVAAALAQAAAAYLNRALRTFRDGASPWLTPTA